MSYKLKKPSSTLAKALLLALVCAQLSACIVAAAGAGAAGGYYFNKHYKVEKKPSHSSQ